MIVIKNNQIKYLENDKIALGKTTKGYQDLKEETKQNKKRTKF